MITKARLYLVTGFNKVHIGNYLEMPIEVFPSNKNPKPYSIALMMERVSWSIIQTISQNWVAHK